MSGREYVQVVLSFVYTYICIAVRAPVLKRR